MFRIGVVLSFVLSGMAAQAETLEFEDIPFEEIPGIFGGPYEEAGYLFEPLDPLSSIGGFGEEKLHVDIIGGPYSSTFRLSRVDAMRFDLKSVLMEPIGGPVILDPQGAPFENNVTFIGYRGATEVGRSNASSQDGQDKTLSFGSILDNVDSVVIQGFLAGNECTRFCAQDIHFTLDNFVVYKTDDAIAAIPLPASGLLLVGGLGAVALVSRRKRRQTAG